MIKLTRPNCPDPSALQNNYKHPTNKDALSKASNGKCMYCESKVTTAYFGDIEHIKPKSKYPGQQFDWQNLGFVCSVCNNTKSDKFDPNCPYIDPYIDDPDSFMIACGNLLFHRPGNERGELTIVDIGLNRANLIEARRTRMDSLQKAVEAISKKNNSSLKQVLVDALMNEVTHDGEYCMTSSSLLKQLYPNGM